MPERGRGRRFQASPGRACPRGLVYCLDPHERLRSRVTGRVGQPEVACGSPPGVLSLSHPAALSGIVLWQSEAPGRCRWVPRPVAPAPGFPPMCPGPSLAVSLLRAMRPRHHSGKRLHSLWRKCFPSGPKSRELIGRAGGAEAEALLSVVLRLKPACPGQL